MLNKCKEHLDFVFNELVNCLPEGSREEAKRELYFAGGCVVNFVLCEPILDYDMFIKTPEYANVLKAYFKTSPPRNGARVIANTENAVTLKLTDGEVIQLVTRFTGEPDRVFKSFDFEHCKSYYDLATGVLACPLDLITKKELVYTGMKDEYTLNTLKRMAKFVSRGWVPTNDTILNLHRAIQNRPHIDTPAERKKQSIGFYGSSFK